MTAAASGPGAPELAVLDGARIRGSPTVSLHDRAVLHGDGLFETLRTFGGRPHRLELHLARLERGREALEHPGPSPVDALREEVALALAETPGEERVIRLFASAGVAPPGLLATAPRPTRAVLSSPLVPPAEAPYREGVAARTLWGSIGPHAPLARYKTTSYLSYKRAVRGARAFGAEEAILLGTDGEVREGATSNIFVVKEGALSTPKESLGILPGVTRAVILELAGRAEIRAEEALLFPSDLYGADEIFLSSSLRGLMPVVRCDRATIGDGCPGPVYRALRALYEADAREAPEGAGRPEMSQNGN